MRAAASARSTGNPFELELTGGAAERCVQLASGAGRLVSKLEERWRTSVPAGATDGSKTVN